jgi:uncharacterized protein YndB with AHSA1/START domain
MLVPFLVLGGVLLIILLVVIVTRPATFVIERSALIQAPAARIFPQLEEFRAWAAWSPWEGMDPQCQRIFSTPSAGLGATYRWVGNRAVGEGEMTITAVHPAERLELTIQFIRPFAATNQVTFTLVPSGTGTQVTWRMRGHNGFLGKAMSLVINCDKLVGGQFATGLAQLKAVSETASSEKR